MNVGENGRAREKRAGSDFSSTHTHTHPLHSLQSGLGMQEAAQVSEMCGNRVKCCAGVRQASR